VEGRLALLATAICLLRARDPMVSGGEYTWFDCSTLPLCESISGSRAAPQLWNATAAAGSCGADGDNRSGNSPLLSSSARRLSPASLYTRWPLSVMAGTLGRLKERPSGEFAKEVAAVFAADLLRRPRGSATQRPDRDDEDPTERGLHAGDRTKDGSRRTFSGLG
jgi:hypothetical protein